LGFSRSKNYNGWYFPCFPGDMAKRTTTRQTSNKAGLRSLGEKLEDARYGFAPQPASRKAEGASGAESNERPMRGKEAAAPTGGKAAAVDKLSKASRRRR
jgi:hypothetical protein